MSDTNPVDGTTETVAPSTPVAPPSGGESPAPTPGSADTAVPGEPNQEQPQAEPRRDRKVEKRISRLTQRAEAAIRDAGYWRGIAEARTSNPTTEPAGDAPPQRQPTPAERAALEAEVELTDAVVARLEEDGADIEDFDEVIDKLTDRKFPGSRTMRDFLSEADKPALLAQWLVENPKEALRISRLTDAMAVRALERAEQKISAKPAPKVTNAPPPVPTVGGRSVANFDESKASMEEVAAVWKAKRGIK